MNRRKPTRCRNCGRALYYPVARQLCTRGCGSRPIDWAAVLHEYNDQIDAVERVMKRRIRGRRTEIREEAMQVARYLLWLSCVKVVAASRRRCPWAKYPALVWQELNRGSIETL